MRIPSQLLLALFAYSVVINAYVIPGGGKHLPSAKCECVLTAVPLIGEKFERFPKGSPEPNPISDLFRRSEGFLDA